MSDRIRQLVLDSDSLPWGEECSAALTEAITLADELGERQWAYAARMRLTQNAAVMGNQELLLATFAICEQWHHDDPGTFPLNPADMGAPGEGYVFADLAWLWKSVIGVLERSLNVTNAMVDRALDDMEELYRSEGLGMTAVHQRRLDRALSRRDTVEIREQRSILAGLPTDEHTDCPACTTAQLIYAALFTGDNRLALKLLDRILSDGQRCRDEPSSVLCLALDLIAADDNGRRVRRAVIEIMRGATVDRSSPTSTARLAVFIARCGHHEQALAMIRSVIGRIADNPTDHSTAEILLACLARVCHAAAPTMGQQPLPELDTPALRQAVGAQTGPLTVATVADPAEQAARDLARRFDERNGTDGHHQRVTEILDPHTIDLDLELPLAAANIAGVPTTLFRIDDPPVDPPTDSTHTQEFYDTLIRMGRCSPVTVDMIRRGCHEAPTPLDRAAMVLLQARATDVLRRALDAAALMTDLAQDLEALGHPDLARAVRLYPQALHSPDTTDLWTRIIDQLPALARSAGSAAAGLIACLHDDLIGRHLWDEADGWLAVARTELPVASWRDQATAARMRLAARRAPGRPDLSWLRDQPVPADESPVTTLARHHALAAIARTDGDPESAYRHQLAATRVQVDWAGAPERARQVQLLAMAAADADRPNEACVAVDHLLALKQRLEFPDDRLAQLAAANALVAARLGRRALPVAMELVEELADEELSLFKVQALQVLGKAQAMTSLPVQGARNLLHAADLLDDLDEPVGSRLTAVEAAKAFLRGGDAVTAGRVAERILEAPHLPESPVIMMAALETRAEAATRIHDADPDVVTTFLRQALERTIPDASDETVSQFQARIMLLWTRWEANHGKWDSATIHAEQGLAICPQHVATAAEIRLEIARIMQWAHDDDTCIRPLMEEIAGDRHAAQHIRQESLDWLRGSPDQSSPEQGDH